MLNYLYLLLIVLPINLINVNCVRVHQLISSIDFEAELEWMDYELPCDGDYIRFARDVPHVLTISQNFRASAVRLPTNGVIYFGNDVTIGKKGRWQCNKQKEPLNKYFNISSKQEYNYYDYIHWRTMEMENIGEFGFSIEIDQKKLLHFEKIPGDMDIILVNEGSSVRLTSPIEIKIMQMNIRDKFIEDQDEMNHFLATKEGRFQWGGVKKIEVINLFGHFEYNWDKVMVEKWKLSRNSNLKSDKMDEICKYNTCLDESELSCWYPINVTGHCCKVCGVAVNFNSTSYLDNTIRFWQKETKHNISNIGVSLVIIDERIEDVPLFQLVVFDSDAEEGREYPQNQINEILLEILDKFKTEHKNMALTLNSSSNFRMSYKRTFWKSRKPVQIFALLLTILIVWWYFNYRDGKEKVYFVKRYISNRIFENESLVQFSNNQVNILSLNQSECSVVQNPNFVESDKENEDQNSEISLHGDKAYFTKVDNNQIL